MDAVLNGPFGQTTLGPAVLTIGRVSTNALVVNDVKASSHHAEISPAGSGYNITDMGSTNGTFVNEQRLDRNVPRMLHPGDRVRIGDTVFTYEVPGAFSQDATVYAGQGSSPGYQPTVAAPPPYTNYDQGYMPPQQGYPPPSAAYPPSYVPSGQPGYGTPDYAGAGAAMNLGPTTTTPRTNRNLLIGLVAGGAIVVVLLIVLFAVVLPSTPTKTLTSYCNALKSGDYHTAYGLLSNSVQSQTTESQFKGIEQQGIAPLGGISGCVVGNVNQNGSTATGTVTYTFGDGKSGPVNYTLVNEGGSWKINREG